MWDLFLILDKTYFSSYAGNNRYTAQKNTSEAKKSLEEISKPLIEWFKDNKMKVNPDKCHLILNNYEIKTINFGNFTIQSSKSKNLPRVTFNNKTNFQSNIENLCSKASKQLHAMIHTTIYMDLSWMFFLICSWTIVHLYGCVTPVTLITKSYMKDKKLYIINI